MFRKIRQDLRNYIFKQIEKEIKLNNNAAKDQLEKGEKLEIKWFQKPEAMDLFGWKIDDGTNVFSNFIFCTLQKKNVAQLILPKKSYLKRTVFCKPLIFWNFTVQIRWTYSCWFIDVLMSPFVRSKMRLGLAVIHFVATCCVTGSNRVDLCNNVVALE